MRRTFIAFSALGCYIKGCCSDCRFPGQIKVAVPKSRDFRTATNSIIMWQAYCAGLPASARNSEGEQSKERLNERENALASSNPHSRATSVIVLSLFPFNKATARSICTAEIKSLGSLPVASTRRRRNVCSLIFRHDAIWATLYSPRGSPSLTASMTFLSNSVFLTVEVSSTGGSFVWALATGCSDVLISSIFAINARISRLYRLIRQR